MGRTTELRQAIKRDLVPNLQDKGFTLDMSDAPRFYRFRKTDSDVELECNVQWEKYGSPRFILNFSKRGPKGLIASGRLAPSQRRTLAGWFCQDRRELEAADDRGLSAAATLGELIGAGSVVICWRLQALA